MSKFDFTNIKSSTGVIDQFLNMVEERILSPDEELNEIPSSFINLYAMSLGNLADNSFYEQMMYKREMEPSIALKLRSIMRKLSDAEISGLFAQPARMTFVVGFPDTQLWRNAVRTPEGNRKIRIGKDIAMGLSNYPFFRMYHDLDIILSTSISGERTVNAMFDTRGRNPAISPIESPFVNVQTGVMIDNESYTFFHIPMAQMDRLVRRYKVNVNGLDRIVPYSNQLIGFEVHYRPEDSEFWTLIPGKVEGNINPSGYVFDIERAASGGRIRFSFNKTPGGFRPTGGDMRITIYTTEGEDGNFFIHNLDEESDSLSINFGQDRDDEYQEPVSRMIPSITVRENQASGGRGFPSLEEIRSMVIEKNTRVDIITPGRINQEANKLGLTSRRTRNDVMIMEYQMSGAVRDNDSMITIPTTHENVVLPVDELHDSIESRSRIVTPRDVFVSNGHSSNYKFVRSENQSPFGDYIADYQSNQNLQYKFPFFIRISKDQYITPRVYDLSVNHNLMTNFVYYNDNTRDRITIDRLQVKRNALVEDSYTIRFVSAASPELISFLKENSDTEDVKFRIEIRSRRGNERMVTSAKIIDVSALSNTVVCEAKLPTNNGILQQSNRIDIRNNTLEPLPYTSSPVSFYFIEPVVDIYIYYIVKNEKPYVTPHDIVLTDNERANNYGVMTVYRVEKVEIVKDLSEIFRLNLEVRKTQPEYAVHPHDVQNTYKNNVYELDENGDVVIEEVPFEYRDDDGNLVTEMREIPVVIHRKGDPMYDENGDPVILYREGDTIYHNGEPEISVPSMVEYVLIDLPLYNRIFSVANWYNSVRGSFLDLVNRITNMRSRIPDGCQVKMGVRKTVGTGSYKFENIKDGRIEFLDNIALSLHLGVKMATVSYDKEFVSSQIIETIIRRINEAQNEQTFSFTRLLEELKSTVPDIEYFEIRRVNSYSAGECQTIFREEGYAEDVLGIKYDVDLPASNITTEEDGEMNVVFRPDIRISFID